jgi:hypothetical protein
MPDSSRDLALGIAAPDFELPDVITGCTLALGELAPSAGLVVAFICNTCPFVKHVLGGLVEFAPEYATRGLTVIAVNSNDAVAHPKDGAAQMRQLAGKRGFTFPSFTTNRNRWRERTRLRVRRSFSYSIRSAVWRTTASSTIVGRSRCSRMLQALTCDPRRTNVLRRPKSLPPRHVDLQRLLRA